MSDFAIIRLGKDSVPDIRAIDALHESPAAPVNLTVRCKQVPDELETGDYVFLCFGSDNSQGLPTEWVRGVRALGTVVSKVGGPGYNDSWDVSVAIKVILPQSVVRRDLLARAPIAYYWCSDVPIIGIEASSQQTVQMIKKEEPHQNVAALACALAAHSPVFQTDTIKAYPALANLFAYSPPLPAGELASVGGGSEANGGRALPELVRQFQAAATTSQLRVEGMTVLRLASSLLCKRFLIATGLAGSGKTKLAQAFARWITPVSQMIDPFVPGARIQSDQAVYVVKKADSIAVEFWNSDTEGDTIKVTLPRAMIQEWAEYITTHEVARETPARDIREAVKSTSKFSAQLHSFETHLKAAAFAMLEAAKGQHAVKCYEIVPVGADWTGNENVLGYPDGLTKTDYITKPALSLILHAKDHPDDPHFLILDEMNLSHVERYFADILSAIESEEGLELYPGDIEKPEAWRKTTASTLVPPRIEQLPKNLFIIGTVNVDETTYMFSPKVLDRANVIEFRVDQGDLNAFLINSAKPILSDMDGKGHKEFGKLFVDAAQNPADLNSEQMKDVKAAYDSEIVLFFNVLQGYGAEFGYRTVYEAARFVHFYKLLGNHPDGDVTWFPKAFDCVIFQKFLPKLHGSRAKLGPLLKALWFLCVNDAVGRGGDALKAAEAAARSTDKKAEPSAEVPAGAPYPLSAEKIGRMWRLLRDNGFASFAEA